MNKNINIILKVDNLKVEFDGERIIENLSFKIKKGETLVILGPNGAGKTVLLRTLLGLIPYQGKIDWKSEIKIGYVPQRLPLIKDIPLSVEEFFKLKKSSKKETLELLNSVGIKVPNILKRGMGEFSAGQFQRILVAWGLVSNPQVLLFDEPMAGIDIGGEETIYNLLEKLKKERDLTILLVTHDLSVVYQKATNVLCLNKKTLCYGPPKEILTPQNLTQLFGGKIKFYQHKNVRTIYT
jgi:zinc transport system ATP-binding protein